MTKRENMASRAAVSRRYFLQVTGSGAVAAMALGGGSILPRSARAAGDPFVWISPRGTIEVLDDYPYWIAKEFGYFGDIETELQPGPSDGTATVKFVDQGAADMGFPSPGIFSFALENGLDLISVWNMGAVDVFDFAFRKGEGVTDLKDLEGKTVLLASAAWQAITDPMFVAAGADPSKINYVEAGWPVWGTALAGGQGDAALAWEGLRADWQGKGFDFEYWIGLQHSGFPANSFVVRRSDVEDPERNKLITDYLRAWAMGLEFGHVDPRAATDIVFEQFPIVKNNLGPEFGTESMMQLAAVFRGDMSKREGWGWHELSRWQLFFDAARSLGQVTKDIDIDKVITNEFVGPANTFDQSRVEADAAGYKVADDMLSVSVDAIKARFYDNAVR